MLEPVSGILGKQRNILASASPRRAALLKSIGFSFEVIPSDFEERTLSIDQFPHPCEYVKEQAKRKALQVWNKLKSKGTSADLIIGADSVVVLDETVFEKPKDKEDAVNMLIRLSGRWHTVFTGVALITNTGSSCGTTNSTSADDSAGEADDSIGACGSGSGPPSTSETGGNTDNQGGDRGGSSMEDSPEFLVTTFHEATHVYMCTLHPSVIRAYVETGEPMDKCGAYSIQGVGATLIETIKGDYSNVVGLPLHRMAKELYHIYSDQ